MRQRRFDAVVTFVCLALLGYFAWHAYYGERGLPYRDRLAAQAQGLADRYAVIEDRRKKIEHRVSLVRPDSIDPDMLDELARAQLEMAAPNEFVVLRDGQIPQGNPAVQP
ncbi:MAG: septum formation initiator family protein [Rhizobiales bacterium]|nr:septum formation initiator family protein [Hyphomicrobiales bacterium]MBI3674102.1 septum formation initiator family protein [Hyphomicrobiales bacterium]